MSVVLISDIDGSRGLETYGRLGVFRIILGIQVESACLAVCSLLNTDITGCLMIDHGVSPTIFLFLIEWS